MRRSSVLVSATAVGNQPTGMNPRTLSARPFRRGSTAAVALLPAFATYNVSPSWLTAIAFGALPSGDESVSRTSMVRSTASRAVSITEIESLFALATYRRLPSALIAIPDGWRPTSMSLTTRFALVSNTEMVPLLAMPVAGSTTTGFDPSVASPACGSRPPQLLTYTLRPSAEIAVLYGNAPVAT